MVLRLSKLARTTLVDQLVETVSDKIAKGDLQPGEVLPGEVELSQQLGVARSTVREALRVLLGLGLLVRSSDGLRVAPELGPVVQARLTPLALVVRETRALYEARRVLEGELAALAALRATVEEIARLRELNDRITTEGKDDHAYWELDMSFHQTVARCARNQVLYAMYEVACQLLKKLEADIVRVPEIKLSTPVRHAALIAAIEARDANKARKVVHAGLREVEAALLRSRVEPPLAALGNDASDDLP